MNTRSDVQSCIKHLMESQYFLECTSVTVPVITGSLKSVFFANTKYDGSYVFKETLPNLGVKNGIMSRMLSEYGFPVPNVRFLTHQSHFFEVYPKIETPTLSEIVKTYGLSQQDVNQAYRQMIDLMIAMGKIPVSEINNVVMSKCADIARLHTSRVNGARVATAIYWAVRATNHGPDSDKGLYHFDMTQNNVLFDNDVKLTGLIDLDSVGVCDRHYALAIMLAKYALMGYDVTDLLDYYDQKSDRPINRTKIKAYIKLFNIGKYALWFHSQFRNGR